MIHKVKTAYLKFALPLAVSTVISITSFAQLPEDALRLSWLPQSGTARNQALGGVMGSLGGDITATFVNPAGLGFYKTNELVFSPGFNFNTNKADFRGTQAKDNKSSFNLGTSGIVLGFPGGRGNKSSAMSIAINRTANFNNSLTYRGSNDFSSFSEQFAEELANSGIDIGTPNLEQANLSLGTKMAIYTYLIDTATINGNTQVIGLPEYLASRNQESNIVTTGGVTEIALGLASNSNDRFYIGGTLGLPIVNYSRRSSFTESDPSTDPNNGFDYANFTESTTTRGIGVNLKAGMIFKPVEALRIGLAVHTPTLYGLRDTYSSTMTTASEDFPVATVSSELFTGNAPAQYDYDLVTPWKLLLSGSYVFGENEDVTKQRGFISADVEYISYKGNSFKSAANSTDVSYYNSINTTIDQIYNSNFNVKVGGELKFETIMARAGFAHYGNPYADKELKAGRNFASAGLGYRDKGLFLDLTYVYAMQNDVNFPYRLGDKANTFAETKTNGGTIMLTAGIKF